ncbi:hypothetical protein [Catellatospora vulcania]|uniref:hypothetical protein n=1 Tax=Catellatospora vulcania TaxID=1460450 RepID=UPI0012D41A07|nr:hypothetical protein [Catellatospora vulcania]
MRDELLRGVAANPAAPAGVLLRLLAPAASASWGVLSGGRDLPVEVVDAILAHSDRRPAVHLARNPYVDPAQRARLLDDPDPRMPMRLASGPMWPAGVRARPLPDDAVRRLLTCDGPLFTGYEILGELMLTPFARQVIALAATHPDAGARARACGDRAMLPTRLWQVLHADPDPQVRAAAAAEDSDRGEVQPDELPASGHARPMVLSTRRLSPALIDMLLAANDSELQYVASNPGTPPYVVEILSRHPDAAVRGQVAARDELSAEQLARLCRDVNQAVRVTVSTHPGLSEAERAAIEVSSWPPYHVHLAVPEVPHTEPEVGIGWAYSANPLLRRRAAQDPRLPLAVAARLAADSDEGVRVLLAYHHPAAPPAALLRAYLDSRDPHRPYLLSRPRFPTAGLVRFARDTDAQVRLLALRDPEVPPHLVDELTRDADEQVRAAAAAHPRLPPHRLPALLDGELVRHAAANPQLGSEALHALLDGAGVPRR